MSAKQFCDLIRALPERLRERARIAGEAPIEGRFVLYWMRTALRAHQNPALDTALLLARRLSLPVFVYQGLTERYPFASDRHHLFILEGARDVASELAERGIGYALHVERRGHRGPHLRSLASRAALTVTEEMPVRPLREWTRGLAAEPDTALVAVDTACVVPMPLTPWPFERAFEFRRTTAEMRAKRLASTWPVVESGSPAWLPELPFEPVDPRSADLGRLVGECRIDHGVAPIANTPGGSTAGYARWQAFRDRGLSRYSRRRNDPLLAGVSRMSAYLHYGMVSPLRLARDAVAEGSAGADKYLDELLVWRELAYAFCYHEPRHRSVEALPGWARQTLAEHQGDPRPQLPSWETLARGRTGDPLWDAAQRSLLTRGELHNNVRMTWGKALLCWTRDAGEALALLEDLNHRYALDGRDPASYGGILWCFGLFDRPFRPERPILGSVRPRPTADHAGRLDVERYGEAARRSTLASPPSVLVIGGGIAGLACARALSDAGLAVRVVDRGRGPGGRVSTRRRDDMTFDHGAQYFTVRDPRFAPWVDSWRHDGLVRRWRGKIGTLAAGEVGETRGETERWVGVPSMSVLGRHLAADLEVEQERSVVALERSGGGWTTRLAEGGERAADVAVLALPAPQAAALLQATSETLRRPLESVAMSPCWTVMAAFDEPLDLALDGAFVADSPLAWVARDSAKPGRPAGERWVLQAGAEWSREHLEEDADAVAGLLLAAFTAALGRSLPVAAFASAHRWRHARAVESLGRDCLYDAPAAIGACGDWCPGERIEGAWLSGVALAGEILRAANDRQARAKGEAWAS